MYGIEKFGIIPLFAEKKCSEETTVHTNKYKRKINAIS